MQILRNPALILAWALPLSAVIGSFLTLGLTLAHPDGELPEQYHWEGFLLDRDFSRGERAALLGVSAHLTGLDVGRNCALSIDLAAPPPQTLAMRASHGTLATFDQQLSFHLVRATSDGSRYSAVYASECRAASAGHWRLELTDPAKDWALRASIHGSLKSVVMAATTGDDD